MKVRDFLPAGSQYIEATGTNDFLCTEAAGVINCVGGNIGPAVSANLTVKAFAPDTPGTYTNQAIVDPDNNIPEGNEFNNQASSIMTVTNGGVGAFHELTIEKTRAALPIDPVARNAVVTYKIVIHNNGTDGVNGITVLDFLPVGSRFISALASPTTSSSAPRARASWSASADRSPGGAGPPPSR